MDTDPEPNRPSDAQGLHTLLKQLSEGTIRPEITLPATLRLSGRLGGEPIASLNGLLEVLRADAGNAETQALIDHLREIQVRQALEVHRGIANPEDAGFYVGDLGKGMPPAWADPSHVSTRIRPLFQLLTDWSFVRPQRHRCPQIASQIESELRRALAEMQRSLAPHRDLISPRLLEGTTGASQLRERLEHDAEVDQEAGEALLAGSGRTVPAGVDGPQIVGELLERFRAAGSMGERERLLDLACAWPSCWIVDALLEMCDEPWARQRAQLLLTLRFGSGRGALQRWEQWEQWLTFQRQQFDRLREELHSRSQAHPLEAVSFRFFGDPALEPWLDTNAAQAASTTPTSFVDRWASHLSREEWMAIDGQLPEETRAPALPSPTPTSSDPKSLPVAAISPEADEPDQPAPLKAAAAKEPRPPRKGAAIWEQHLRPFFIENWYFVAGIMMVIVGSSLLAYYTWDKHWMWRYTIMPGLLALFTAGFAGAARWIESRGEEFRGTAATLRGTAIALLPVNFMTMALVSNDDQVTQKVLVLSIMALVYLGLAGWGLHRWCSAAHPQLGWPLGGTLLALNFLAALAPLARSVFGAGDQSLVLVLGTGFHIGFFLMAAAIVYFGSRVLDAKMARDKRVPWFFGITLGITFLQVFAWIHGYLNYLPQVHTYAPMTILAGGLVLYIERRSLSLLGEETNHRAESFFGYALILAGLLMGASHEHVRILSFTLASAVWIYQASPRRQAIHFWIGLTLLVLAGASVGLLEGFPKEWLAAIGVTIGIGMSAGDLLTRRHNPQLAEACRGIQLAVFLLTVVVAVLTQWHFRTEPWATGVCLLAMVAFFAWSSIRYDELRWMDAAMVTVAVALPYLGFVDMRGHTLHGNHMVFGLGCVSAIWLLLAWRLPQVRVIVESRSTVIWIYGTLAVIGMLLRVFVERGAPVGVSDLRDFMDQAGPFLMAASLVCVAYFSRSLVPALMASVIAVILFPELQATLRPYMPPGFWGSGLGSALSALGMTIVAMVLKAHPRLQSLEGGDRFLGKHEFPLRRNDHTIFTIPLIFSSLFLLCKLVWLVASQWVAGQEYLLLNSGIALLVAGATWWLLAGYLRDRAESPLGVHLGWLMMLAGFGILHLKLAEAPDHHWTWPVLFCLLTLQAVLLICLRLKERHRWIDGALAGPLSQVTEFAAALLGVGFCVTASLHEPGGAWWILFALVGAQLAWRSLAAEQPIYANILVLLAFFGLNTWLATGGDGLLIERMSRATHLMPNLYFALGIHLAFIGLERLGTERYQRVRSLCLPFLVFASLLSIAIAGYEISWQMNATPASYLWPSSALVVLAVGLTARAQCSCPAALAGLALIYGFLHSGVADSPIDRLEILLSPWRLAAWALVVVLATVAGNRLARHHRGLIAGPFALPGFRSTNQNWLLIPAVGVATSAALAHALVPSVHDIAVQLWTPFLAAAVALLAGRIWENAHGLTAKYLAVAWFVVGNVHSVRLVVGEWFLESGLSELHLICIGGTISLLALWLLRAPFRRSAVVSLFNSTSLVLSGLMLSLLVANYITYPDLEQVTTLRMIVSGLIALVAAIFFRRAARHPGPGEQPYQAISEKAYHFGLTIAIWCGTLIVPWLRQPELLLAALAAPAVYFFVRAASPWQRKSDVADRYRNPAIALTLLVLALYAMPGVMQLILHPETPADSMLYHTNAPIAVIASLFLFRLHGLGGDRWQAFTGGVALMASSYFLLTWIPGLSPFSEPVAGAWCAVILGHFWMAASSRRSPIKRALQSLAGINAPRWFRLRRGWGYWLIGLVHLAVLWGLSQWFNHPHSVALLIAAAASVTSFQGVIGRSRTYLWIALAELLAAMHSGFLVDSFLAADHVIWALLGLWALQLSGTESLARHSRERAVRLRSFGIVMMISVFAHILYHHPASTTGLVAMAASGFLIALGRRESPSPRHLEEWLGTVALPLIPVWLVYFSQARNLAESGGDASSPLWPLMAALGALLGVAALGRLFQIQQGSSYLRSDRTIPRLFDHTLWWFADSGRAITRGAMRIGVALLAGIVVLTAAESIPLQPREMMLGVTLWLAIAAGWFTEMRRSNTVEPAVLLQGSLLGAYLMIRHQLSLTHGSWSVEYDVWMSLAAALTLAGLKDLIATTPGTVRTPFLVSLCAMPVVGLGLVYANGLGPDIALVVVGLHSLIFAFLGRGSKDSPYNAVATLGFVAFVLLTFWTKLELRTLNAYVIPSGLGVLVLVQLFRDHMSKETQTLVRTVTLVAMLCSAGYYSILDPAYPVAFHLTMLLLCLGIMGLGGWLKVRIYLYLGFAGLMVDLCALGYKQLVGMDRGIRMTVIGAIVLLIGVSLVVGAVYFKTHRDEISARLRKWRSRSNSWT